jgi:peptidyl-prolyl cis-trans isomerase A (cyclophilin A)
MKSGKYRLTACSLLLSGLITFLVACGDGSQEGQRASGDTRPARKAIIETSMGNIVCELYPDKAPMTVDIISGLAEGTREWTDPTTNAKKVNTPYYNGVLFHRVIPDFMIQTGDPTGTGRGGPGFAFDDEFDPELRFDRVGRLAMANRGPNTNGGQFFITVAPTPHLDGRHTIFGQVIEGQDVADAISRARRDGADRPEQDVTIRRITIERGES